MMLPRLLRIMPAGRVPTIMGTELAEALQGPVFGPIGKPPGGHHSR